MYVNQIIFCRFSKDIDITETKIPETFRHTVRFGFNVVAVLAVCSYTSPFFLILMIPILVFYYLIQVSDNCSPFLHSYILVRLYNLYLSLQSKRFYLNFSRQIKRLDSASASHIYSFYGESLNGISTIRAFKAEDRFITQMQTHVNNNLIIHFSNLYAAR